MRELYTAEPDAATVPLVAEGDWRDDGITTTVETWAGPVRAGLHRATGGSGADACSADLLLQAVLACVGVTLRSVATAMDLDIRGARLTARSTFDARGTLGVDRTVPVGVTAIEVLVEVGAELDDAVLERLGSTTERYCVVGQSLREPVRIVVRRAGATAG